MKTQLTKEQSQHLFNLGVPKGKASDKISYGFLGYDPIFTLADILEILPKEIDNEDGSFCLEIQMMNGVCSVSYEYFSNGGCKEYFEAKELIDSLYELCVWTIENGYLKFE